MGRWEEGVRDMPCCHCPHSSSAGAVCHLMSTRKVSAPTGGVLPYAHRGGVVLARPLGAPRLEGSWQGCAIQSRALDSGQKGILPGLCINIAWFPVLLLNLGKKGFYIRLDKELSSHQLQMLHELLSENIGL